jgi:hypothetical protein
MVSAERLTFKRAMTKPSEMLCPKTGSKALNYIKTTFFIPKSILTAAVSHWCKRISQNLTHFAEVFSFCQGDIP